MLSDALSDAERARVIAVANKPRFAETPSARIVPALADARIYIACETARLGVIPYGCGAAIRPVRSEPSRA